LPRALALADRTPLTGLADSIRWEVARHPRGRDILAAKLAAQPDADATRNLRIMAFALKDDASAPMPRGWAKVQARFPDAGDVVDQLTALFGDKAVLAKMRGILADTSQPQAKRKFAFDLLKRSNDPEATPIFARLLDVDAFRSAVIPLLGRSADPATAEALIHRFAKLDAADKSAALAALCSRSALALPLLRAVQSGAFDRGQLTALQVRQMRNLRDAEVDKMLDQTWGKVNESSEAAKTTIARLKKTYSAAPLWAYNGNAGRETFTQVCAVCHAFNGVGGKVGPDLGGSWRNGLDYFLENIVDPNAVVGENYQLHVITKKDGSVMSGLIEQESGTAVTLRTLTESLVIAKSEIKDHQKLAQSLMPPGLLEALPERKAIELLKFLTSKQ
jgi:putative heme-binding domain-containing protein